MVVQCTLAVAEVGPGGERPWGMVEKEVGSGGRKRRRKAGEGRKMEKKRGGRESRE